ncbi:hypothetical protein RRG08_050164 [Elysia crispata]|uniref:Uncharacterized protein n=1 Tax=Elysia crispata TaxID=231223 RepID=A0AAE0YD72_9GAST|nr:hypothetical protein RRG08_050164 [Elysia crispata]
MGRKEIGKRGKIERRRQSRTSFCTLSSCDLTSPGRRFVDLILREITTDKVVQARQFILMNIRRVISWSVSVHTGVMCRKSVRLPDILDLRLRDNQGETTPGIKGSKGRQWRELHLYVRQTMVLAVEQVGA